ncbi:hypothetical protein BAY61_15245 [Prauserella marina]|uniref:Ferredoxin-NADP reductase n=1 Tax=Prauserella marina TaxID=530584 RepID=A0A222VQC0_9PSEU|nr:PDR/VanB family oxidoreductase [Prauserella marina]ASR36136.1 hypothetical protein BAY61_15245 [Prauserella marina]PWV76876.1 ferredoxin-NADP reductase [Prauserella marina]SDC99524.1 Ferredoxin-NADP reductase [Prauserella marina]
MTGFELRLRITGADSRPGDVRSLRLRDDGGGRLPGFTPGSHLVLDCAGRRNAYSLTGPAMAPEEYHLSVLLRSSGNGGSAYLHGLDVGSVVRSSRPRSAFPPVATARHHLFVAGGIGITPMLAHVREALRWDRSFTLVYVYRRGRGAHLPELRALCGDRLSEPRGRDETRAVLGDLLTSRPLGTHLYLCGPGSLTDMVTTAATAAGWPGQRVHTERFSAADHAPGNPFTAIIAGSGETVAVGGDESLLSALRRAGHAVPSLCEQGVCGECRVGVLSGTPQHRDHYLTPAERASGEAVMCCVSRAGDEGLVLDL